MYISIILYHLKLILWAALVTVFVFIMAIFCKMVGMSATINILESIQITQHSSRTVTSAPTWQVTSVSKMITRLAAGKAGEKSVGGDK
jgi:presenilin-like A22 family membrane protease